jgi:hypothetical protein
VDGPVVLVAQLDQIGQVSRAAVAPMDHVMDVGEFGIGAPRPAAAPVTAPDLDPLRVGR